jgi:hypothetical protein
VGASQAEAPTNQRIRESSIGANLPAGWIEQHGLIDPSTIEEGEEEKAEAPTPYHVGFQCVSCGKDLEAADEVIYGTKTYLVAHKVCPAEAPKPDPECWECGKLKSQHYLLGNDPKLCETMGIKTFVENPYSKARLVAAPSPQYRCAYCGDFLVKGPCDETVMHFEPCKHKELAAAPSDEQIEKELDAWARRLAHYFPDSIPWNENHPWEKNEKFDERVKFYRSELAEFAKTIQSKVGGGINATY